MKETAQEKLVQEAGDTAGKNLPKNKRGVVDEWISMEQQKQRAVEALLAQQREEKMKLKKKYQ